jgi:hypothetical protein
MVQVIIGEKVNPLDYERQFADLTVCSSLKPFIEALRGYAGPCGAKLGIIVNDAQESREVYRAVAQAYDAEVIEVSL